jgi:hypothetical protein
MDDIGPQWDATAAQVVRLAGDYDFADNLLSIWVAATMSSTRKWLRDGAVPRLLAQVPGAGAWRRCLARGQDRKRS